MNPSKLEKLAAQVRTGGKGSVRRKAKKVHKSAGADDKKLQAALQRLPGFNTISGIEEVNLFNADGTVVHFVNPKVQASVEANTFAISGHSETKKIEELLPGIISQLGLESLMQMRNLSEHQHHHHHDHDHDHDHEHEHEHEHHEEAPAAAAEPAAAVAEPAPAAAEEKPAEKPAEEKPAEKPAEEKPAEEKPAEKPAEEKPAEEAH